MVCGLPLIESNAFRIASRILTISQQEAPWSIGDDGQIIIRWSRFDSIRVTNNFESIMATELLCDCSGVNSGKQFFGRKTTYDTVLVRQHNLEVTLVDLELDE